jgi:hypothetical protein
VKIHLNPVRRAPTMAPMRFLPLALVTVLALLLAGPAAAQRLPPKLMDVYRVVGEIRAAEGEPVVALLYGSECSLTKSMFPGFVQLSRDFQPRGVKFLVFNTDGAEYGEYAGEFLQRHKAGFENLVVRDWAQGELKMAMSPLGIRIGSSWTRPLAAVFDRGGKLVFQSQGETDLRGLRNAVASVAR